LAGIEQGNFFRRAVFATENFFLKRRRDSKNKTVDTLRGIATMRSSSNSRIRRNHCGGLINP
jgi:hypothetical protein